MHECNYITVYYEVSESLKVHAGTYVLLFLIMYCVLHWLKGHIFVGGGVISTEGLFCGEHTSPSGCLFFNTTGSPSL